ncbi:MAG: segregation/condensation protein A [Proteobacteria bacterium]|nr:segregation/condensation protein A [Pseudomonadota bacterium]
MNLLVPTLEVKMECYEGPLAVLITLIKRNKVSIWDIPLSTITERFLQYVELVSEMNLKIAEDFIEMASLLIFIKSRMLLPSDGIKDEENDPGGELVERIIEYEMVRSMANTIDSLPMLNRDAFSRGRKSIDGEEDYNLLLLCNVFFELIKSKEESYIVINEIKPTLEEKLKMLITILDTSGLYVWDMKQREEQSEKIATILGILELTKIRVATLSQRRPFGKIILKKRIAISDQQDQRNL